MTAAPPDDLDEMLDTFQSFVRFNNRGVLMNILAHHQYDLEHAMTAFTSYCTPIRPLPPPPLFTANFVPWRLVVLPNIGFTALLDIHSAPRLLDDAPLVSSVAGSRLNNLFNEPPVFDPLTGRFGNTGFSRALQRARLEGRPMFLHLYSTENPESDRFFHEVLYSEIVVPFLWEKFEIWIGSPLKEDGLIVSYRFQMSCFPCSIVVLPLVGDTIMLVYEIKCHQNPERMLQILTQVEAETSKARPALINEAEEKSNSGRWSEFQSTLEAYRKKKVEENERKLRKEVAKKEAAKKEAAMRETEISRSRQEKINSLGDEPQSGPDVIQVAVRFQIGTRKVRRFHKLATIKSIYDFVDSFYLGTQGYTFVSICQHKSFGREMHYVTLEEAGLDQETLYVKNLPTSQ